MRKVVALVLAAGFLVSANMAFASKLPKGYDEDSASANGDVLTPTAGVVYNNRAATSGTDGDYAPLIVTNSGALYVTTEQDGAPVSTYTASVTATGSSDSGANSIYRICATNGDGTNAHYVKVYDKSSAATQADTPILKIALAAVDTKCMDFGGGITISNGISLRATTENADSGTTGADANDVSVTMMLED